MTIAEKDKPNAGSIAIAEKDKPNAASIAIRSLLLLQVSQVGEEQQHQIEAVIHCSSFCFGWAPIWRDAN